MIGEQRHPEDSQSPEPSIRVSANEFAALDVEAPIRGARNVDCWTLKRLYHAAASKAENSGDELAVRVFGLLCDIAGIHLKPEDRAEPYGPQFVVEGRRSMIPSDVRGEQSTAVAELVPAIRNPGLRARLADIAWSNHRNLAVMARQAIDAYCEAVQLVLDGGAEFFDNARSASNAEGCRMLRRASQIAHATGRKEPESSRLGTLIGAVIRDAVDQEHHRGFIDTARVALDFGVDDPATIAANAERFAVSSEVDPHWSRDLWGLAAQAHHRLRDDAERDRCRVEAAECFVTIAEAAGGKGMVAASAYMNAIQELRKLRNTKQRRQELGERLRHAQASVRDEMGVISTTVDLTEHANHARRTVSGVTLAQALAEFAILTESPDPGSLRDEALQQCERTPFASMMPASVVDDDGKQVAVSPGLFGDGEDFEEALRHLIVRNEGFRRQCDVQGLISPARRTIQCEHPLEERDLRAIVEMSPFVPVDRVDLFATGFARFFGGDFVSALHVLVPQLENSLRHVLKQAGVEPSAIQSDMTQENRTISVMLDKDRGSLEATFGPAIVYEIENLFDFRGGPSIRHQLAHGLVSGDRCYDTDSIYACWFMFRLCCLPLFPRWERVAETLDQL